MYLLRGVNSYLMLGGQIIMLPGGAFYTANSWVVGNGPLCPLLSIYAPAIHRYARKRSE